MKKLLTFLVVMCMLFSTAAMAEDIWQLAQSPKYGKKAGGMFARGLVNAASCFVDLIVQTVDKTKQGPPVIGTLTGIGGGAGCTILRAGSGIVDVATFWVPGFNGVPVSKSYSNCLEVTEKTTSTEWQAASQTGYNEPVVYEEPVQAQQVRSPESYAKPGGKSDAYSYVKK